MKVDPYYQRRTVAQGSLFLEGNVYADIRRGSLERGFHGSSNESVVIFSLLSLAISSEPSHLRPQLLYYAM